MAKAVIFDVDGTLVDSVDLHAKAWQDVLAEFGHPVDFQAVRTQIGKGGDQLMPVFLSKADIAAFGERLQARRAEILKSRYMDQIRPFPHVRDLFLRLHNDNIRVALASSAKEDELDAYKRIAEIDDLIDKQTSSDDAERSKPYPDIFQAALARLRGIAVADVVAVGDTPYDAQAAGKAGLRAIGVLCGGFSEADLKDAGCLAIYRDVADLLERYDASLLSDR